MTFETSIVTGAQILRAVPGAAERTLRSNRLIDARSHVTVGFHGTAANCRIGRDIMAAKKATKRDPDPQPTYKVYGTITLPGVDPDARIPRHIALDFMTYALHELAHAVFTDRSATTAMLTALAAELNTAYPGRVTASGLHRLWNCIEDPRIEGAMVRHGMARGYEAMGRQLVNKHWTEGAAERAAAHGDRRASFALLPLAVAYVGRQWLPADARAAMRAELPTCIRPALDAACTALAVLHAPGARAMAAEASAEAQARDVLPILRGICIAMLDANSAADAPEGDSGDADAPGDKGQPGTGDRPGQPGDKGQPGDGEGQPGDKGEPGAEGDGEGQPGEGEGDGEGEPGAEGEGDGDGQPGEGEPNEGDGADRPADKGAAGGKNQAGGLDLTDAGLTDAGVGDADSVTAPTIDQATLEKIGTDNPLSPYGDARISDRLTPQDEATRDAHIRTARHAVKNPGGIAYQLRRLLSKTDTSEYRRGLSHGRLRVQALPRALASGAGAFQRRLEFGSDRVSITVMVDTSGSMSSGTGTDNVSRAAAAGHVTALLLDALRGCVGSQAYVFGFGGSTEADDFSRAVFKAETIKEWNDSYPQGQARAAGLRGSPHGGTPIKPALAHGLKSLRTRPEGRKILLCLTDGDFQNVEQERALVEKAERAGIICIGVGIGIGAQGVASIFARHHVLVQDASALSEQMLRALADAVLSEGVLHAKQ